MKGKFFRVGREREQLRWERERLREKIPKGILWNKCPPSNQIEADFSETYIKKRDPHDHFAP